MAHKGISGYNSRSAGEFCAHTGVLSSIKFKGGAVGGGMDVVVVCKLHDWSPVSPVILAVVDEHTEVGFNFLVNMLGLVIGLWVVGSGRGESDSKQCC